MTHSHQQPVSCAESLDCSTMSGPGLGATKQTMAQIGAMDVVGIGATAHIVTVGVWPVKHRWHVDVQYAMWPESFLRAVVMRGGMQELRDALLCLTVFEGSVTVSGRCWSSAVVIGFVRIDPFHRSTLSFASRAAPRVYRGHG